MSSGEDGGRTGGCTLLLPGVRAGVDTGVKDQRASGATTAPLDRRMKSVSRYVRSCVPPSGMSGWVVDGSDGGR